MQKGNNSSNTKINMTSGEINFFQYRQEVNFSYFCILDDNT